MTGTLLFVMAMRGQLDPAHLHGMVARENERRRSIFCKLADLLFGVFMFLFGDLNVTVQSGGRVLAATDPEVSADDKLTAILAGMQATDHSMRFRELFRPLLKAAAEFVSDMLGPDEESLALVTELARRQAAAVAAAAAQASAPAPAAPAAPAPSPAAPRPAAAAPRPELRQYEGKLLQALPNPTVWHIENGQRRGIQAPDVMRRKYGADFVNGRWTRVQFVTPGVIDLFPIGKPEPSTYEGQLLQATDGSPTVWHIQNGQRHGITGPEVMARRYGSRFVNGRWTKVQYVPAALINDFPIGSTES